MSDKIELNRRRVLGGIATVGAASAALGAGTFAYFSDTETSTGNSITAGDLDLTLNSGDGFSYSFDNNIAPGDSATVSVNLENTGSVMASHIEVATSLESDPDDLASQILIDEVRWAGNTQDLTQGTLADLASNSFDLDAAEANDSPAALEIDVRFNPNAGDEYQNASTEVNHTFTLYQHSSQGS